MDQVTDTIDETKRRLRAQLAALTDFEHIRRIPGRLDLEASGMPSWLARSVEAQMGEALSGSSLPEAEPGYWWKMIQMFAANEPPGSQGWEAR